MGANKCNEELYSDMFRNHDSSYMKGHKYKIDITLSVLDRHSGGRLLDVGCGSGSITIKLSAESRLEPYGLEISESNVRLANEQGVKARKCNIDGNKLPFEDGFFDVVYCGDIIEHIYATEFFIKEIKRVLKKDGYAILTIPNTASWYNRFTLLLGYVPNFLEATEIKPVGNPFQMMITGHIRSFTKKAIIELMNRYGLRIEELKGFSFKLDYPEMFERFPELNKYKRLVYLMDKADKFISEHSSSLATGILVKVRK